MRYDGIYINALSYELPSETVTTPELEEALTSAYQALHLPKGQLEAMTGIRQRRWWPRGFKMSDGAIAAGKKALAAVGLSGQDLDVLIYTGVCRDYQEPATASRVAAGLGVRPEATLFDLSNACLGALNGMLDIANRLALGQAQLGMVVCCESSRDLSEDALARFLKHHDVNFFKLNFAIFTGGSGAAAIILSKDPELGRPHRLLGGIVRNASQHHDLCTWAYTRTRQTFFEQALLTDSVGVLQHGVALGVETWGPFLQTLEWSEQDVDKIVSHQVGITHRKQFLDALKIPESKDFPTYPTLGNMASASLPITAAMADAEGFLRPGHRVAWLGFGSGLNCIMLGTEW